MTTERDPNILDEKIIVKNGHLEISKEWLKKPTSPDAQEIQGYTGREFVEEHVRIKPVFVLKVVDN